MKPIQKGGFCIATGIVLVLAQCSTSTSSNPTVAAGVTSTGRARAGNMSKPQVVTRTLINRPLTNKDIGKVYQVVTTTTPSGTTVSKKVIVRALPDLATVTVPAGSGDS